MNLHQNDIGDVLMALPDLTELNKRDRFDFIICTLGFEERSYKVLHDLLNASGSNFSKLILIKYPTNKSDNEENLKYFEDCRSRLADFIDIEYSRGDFYSSFSNLVQEKIPVNSRVIFDVSTCSSYLFYPIFKVLIESTIQLTISYAEAEFYYPSKEEWTVVEEKAKRENQLFVKSWDEAHFQSMWVDDIYSSNLFSEMNSGNKPSLLVAVPNFNSIRMQSIKERDNDNNKTDSNNIKWLIGRPPKEVNHWRAEALLKTNTLEEIRPANLDYVSTLYYKETLKSLEAIWEDNKYTSHISIGSLGSKMQHLGTFFFVYLHPDVGLWLAEPKEFKAKAYSKGSGDLHQISFGNTENLRGSLAKYMQFEWKF